MLILIALLGLIFGSFINALVWRIHTKRKWVNERSMCPHCKHILAAKDLVPVFSWLTLRGKCRYCKKPIEDTPIVEIATALLFAGSYLAWPFGFEIGGAVLFASWLVCLVVLIALAVYDIRWMLLPNKMVATITVLASINVLILAVGHLHAPATVILEAVLAATIIAGLFWVLFQVSKGKWIGGGDVKLAVALGLLAGTPIKAFLLIFIASVLGTIVSLPLLASKRLKVQAKIPFGPFLIAATIIVYLFGSAMIEWYKTKILYL